MADQTNMNEILEAMRTSMVALNETMKNYNLRIMDSFKVFQNLDTSLKNLTENIDLNIKNVNADLQNFAEKLQTLELPNKNIEAFNGDIKNTEVSLQNFAEKLQRFEMPVKNFETLQNNIESSSNALKSFTENLAAVEFPIKNFEILNKNVETSAQDLQNFAEKLRTIEFPNVSSEASDIKASTEALQDFTKSVNNDTASLKDFGSALDKLTQSATQSAKTFAANLADVNSADSRTAGKKKTGLKAPEKTPAPPKDSKNAFNKSGAADALTGMLGRVNMAFTFVKKVVEIGAKSIVAFNAAIIGSIAAFSLFTNRVKAYVQAYNPNLVKQFDYVLKDITAVIGKALQPVLIALGAAFRTLGDILVPVMDALAPAFQMLAKAVGNFLLPLFNALGNALKNAAPLINRLAEEFAKVAGELGEALGELMPELIRYLADYLKGWIEQLKAVKNLQPFLDMWSKFNRAFLQAKNILLGAFNSFAGYMQKLAFKLRSWLDWFGITTPGKNYVSTTVEAAKKGESTGMAAREAEYMNVEDLSRGLIKAAYGSGQDIQRQQLEQQRMMNGQLAQINQKIGRQNVAPQPFQAGLRMA